MCARPKPGRVLGVLPTRCAKAGLEHTSAAGAGAHASPGPFVQRSATHHVVSFVCPAPLAACAEAATPAGLAIAIGSLVGCGSGLVGVHVYVMLVCKVQTFFVRLAL